MYTVMNIPSSYLGLLETKRTPKPTQTNSNSDS